MRTERRGGSSSARSCFKAMKTGYFQFNPTFGEVKRNLDTVSERLAGAECDLLVLPELFTSGYQFVSTDEARALAEEVPGGPTTSRLMQIAADRRMHLVAGL